MKPAVLLLFGPTASGKTSLLERLFAPGTAEIISADSMQVYRGMDIGTAKPSPEERARIPHHLLDIRNPDEQFNAGEFVRLAEEACLSAAGHGALPVVSGGTGFYLKNFVMGLSEAPPSDRRIHGELREELSVRGAASLMKELAEADPVSAGRIHINDEYRILRALEVYRFTGRPLSSFSSPWSNCSGAFAERPFVLCLAGLRWNREELYRRINARTAAMFRSGLADEVGRLYKAGYTPSDPGLRAIGYREFFVRETNSSKGNSGVWRLSGDLTGVEALVAQNSRRYAKRQICFFASLPGVKWIDCGEENTALREISELAHSLTFRPVNSRT